MAQTVGTTSGVSSAAALSALSVSGLSSLGGQSNGRATFAADELAIVLSHYDLGVIEAIQAYPRGSRKAPKSILRTETGLYLLKRRAKGKDDPFKTAFCHGIQMRLAEQQFPLPHLIGTRRHNNSMLRYHDATYELFEYIKGNSYDNSLEASTDAGKVLALFHKLLGDYTSEYDPPQGSYHQARSVASAMKHLPQTLTQQHADDPEDQADVIAAVTDFARKAYQQAAGRIEDMGLADWPKQIVHSDWHPGNMLFRGARVVAVIDYDAARIQQRILDIANGALQFSILGGGDDASKWPAHIDGSRFKRFLRGYDSVPDAMLSRAEIQAIPWLMIEALIAESVIPIATTGSFARMEGLAFLQMVRRKVRWIQKHADDLVQLVDH